jgi:uncharacterized protein YycO
MNKQKLFLIIGLAALILLAGLYAKQRFYDPKQRLKLATQEVKQLAADHILQNGDLIFQTSLSGQSKAIQFATHSEYSHCGIIYKHGEHYVVLEAIQTVRETPLEKWIARGQDGHYVIKRLKTAADVLTPATLQKMKKVGDGFSGKSYDLCFEWSDTKLYCSELIWKIYQRATGLEIGKLEKLRDFDLTSPEVMQKLTERYGDHIPLDETVISPASIYNSDLLTTVKSN